ncbi:MAG: hypothetical protein HFI74_03180 [Lachnospiraceae bacterium]|nr:hypothetical protein [Lachnospiraceae bacterium]
MGENKSDQYQNTDLEIQQEAASKTDDYTVPKTKAGKVFYYTLGIILWIGFLYGGYALIGKISNKDADSENFSDKSFDESRESMDYENYVDFHLAADYDTIYQGLSTKNLTFEELSEEQMCVFTYSASDEDVFKVTQWYVAKALEKDTVTEEETVEYLSSVFGMTTKEGIQYMRDWAKDILIEDYGYTL